MAAAYPINAGAWLQYAWRNRMQSLLLLVVTAGFLALLGRAHWYINGL